LVPDHNAESQPAGLLTGLHGFPWPERRVDAKCTQQDRAVDGIDMRHKVDRYHRVVPAENCTSGIYAGRDELVRPRIPKPPRARPLVTGFVELGGRVVEERDVYRAQQATIVGPLTIWLGRPPLTSALRSRFGGTSYPRRVVTAHDEYRVQWSRGTSGMPVATWLAATAGALKRRYQVDVVIPNV
jgi:hypothetical protein